ncbi:hypothetical protein [Burkholderia pseudomallei]|uniref:hypothetical protein n=1 Tax=Burkholderia pseudomallei TaxID=28450 RepID=UPI000B2FEF78|nr:hypothetical protein [Burkholderia pseudomallei]
MTPASGARAKRPCGVSVDARPRCAAALGARTRTARAVLQRIFFNGGMSGGECIAAGSSFKEHQMSRTKRMWREVEGAVEVTALAAIECALLVAILVALGFPHAGI